MDRLSDIMERASERNGGLSRKLAEGFGPVRSSEVRRVAALPRRPVAPDLELRDTLNRWLRVNQTGETLKDAQARAVAECVDSRGGLVSLGVGHGKGHIAWLLVEAFAREHGIVKTVLLVPSGLRDATRARQRHMIQDGWALERSCAVSVQVVGYQELQQARNVDLLTRLDPDLIIADEAHYLRRRTSARTTRFMKFMREREKQGRPVAFVAMSGTLMKRTPLDYWELAKLTLGDEGSPLPKGWKECADWSRAIMPGPERSPAGALSCFVESPGESLDVAFGRRVRETEGVISSDRPSVDASLTCRRYLPKVSDAIRQAVESMDDRWEIPGGPAAVDALGFDRLLAEISLGYWSRVVFPSAEEERQYRAAAKNWREVVRSAARAWSKDLDSDLRVRQAIDLGQFDGVAELAEWRRVGEMARERHVEWFEPVWLIDTVSSWLAETSSSTLRGLVWVDRIDVGQRLAMATGVPYLGAGADSESFDGPAAIISAKAHGTGRNLQRFDRSLILTPSPSGDATEQLIGRTHREGQRSDMVSVDFLTHTEWARRKLDLACVNAKDLEIHSGQPQRLCFADWEAVSL